MLGVRTYPQSYIDECRTRIDRDLVAYRGLVAAANAHPEPQLTSALEAFERVFFNNMVIVLDALFVHRLRTVEGKDGNPLNEVRVLCNCMLNNKGVMAADSAIKLSPGDSILKHQVGDPINLTEADFMLISNAFFAEVERKYV